MPTAATIRRSANATGIITVGIDVGGERKGFHAVALMDGRYMTRLPTASIQGLAHWCRETVKAEVIAVDAPCGWSIDGHSRPAERELMSLGIWCFSTPTREVAVERRRQHSLGKATNHYGWMLRGAELYQALEAEFPVCRELPAAGRKCCFETYPHAITWHLRGGNAAAKQKRNQRRALLEQARIDLSHLTNIDFVDAALCALTAYRVATGSSCVSFGEPATGTIIVPGLPNQ